jgi:hypothetical protein
LTPKKISAVIKNNKTSKLGTIRDTNGKLTESPEDTLEVLTKTHFKDGVAIGNPGLNPNSADRPSSPPPEEKLWDPALIFSEKRTAKAIANFDPLSAAGPDGIRPIMLQKGWEQLGKSLTNIARSSYELSAEELNWDLPSQAWEG